MKLNADIGESYGIWQMSDDAKIMQLIDEANVACGAHAGDPLVMQQTLQLAVKYGVSIGAHVSYPDIQGFGRRSMVMPRNELTAFIHAQIATLEGMAKCQGASVDYVKPHGALYNDMMRDLAIFESILIALSTYHFSLPLVIQALLDNEKHIALAESYDIELRYEGFSDRAYDDKGLLIPRTQHNAVLNNKQAIQQVKTLLSNKEMITHSGQKIKLLVDTLCVHGDSPSALALCQDIRLILDAHFS
jgi:UPF0271 protein